MYSRPFLRMSASASCETSEESLSIEMNSFPIAGRTTFTVWGRMTWMNVCVLVIPSAVAASLCPFGMAWMPARTISPMYAPKQMDRAMIAAIMPSMWRKRPSA